MAGIAGGKIVRMGRSPRRFRFKWRYVLLAATAIWAAYVYFFLQMPILRSQAAEKARLTAEMAQVKTQTAQLRTKVALLHSYSYIAQLAEKKYNLILPGEILFTSAGHSR